MMLLLLVVVQMVSGQLLRDAYPRWTPSPPTPPLGKPLLLTPLLQEGLDATARRLAEVNDLFPCGLSSYAGFLTVNSSFNSNLFFWFFPAKSRVQESPLVLWLQGGPGASSLFGLFTEIGPYSVESDGVTLRENPHSWLRNHSLLFVDNPVGTGFSFTDDDRGYASDMEQVGADLDNALRQFFTMFDALRDAPFYIAGESFAGKYIPAVGNSILEGNRDSDHPINLKGVLIGNGYYDPENQLELSELSFSLGLVDHDARQRMREEQQRTLRAIQAGNFTQAFYGFSRTVSLLRGSSRQVSLYNVLVDEEEQEFPYGAGHFVRFVERREVRRAIHVGDAELSSLGGVYARLVSAFMTSSRGWLQRLLDSGVRALCYSGQLDVLVGYALSAHAYSRLRFQGAALYRAAPRTPWHDHDGRLAGFLKSGGGFSEALVRGAGHLVPADQPQRLLALVTSFTLNTTLPRVTSRPHLQD